MAWISSVIKLLTLNGGSQFFPDWDGLLLAQLEWLGMAEVGFSLSGMV
jgi:hypothetical protein